MYNNFRNVSYAIKQIPSRFPSKLICFSLFKKFIDSHARRYNYQLHFFRATFEIHYEREKLKINNLSFPVPISLLSDTLSRGSRPLSQR